MLVDATPVIPDVNVFEVRDREEMAESIQLTQQVTVEKAQGDEEKVPTFTNNILGALVFKNGAKSPHFEVEAEAGIKCIAPLDLGADATLISNDFFCTLRESNPKMEIIPNCAKLYDVGGGNVKTLGRCWVNLKFGHVRVRHPVYVCDIQAQLLVGADLLWRMGCLVDLVGGYLRSGRKEVVEFDRNWRGIQTVQVVPEACQVEVVETVTIPKFTDAQRVCIKLVKNQDIGGKEGTVNATESLKKLGLEMLDCLIPTDRRWAWVYVRNRTAGDNSWKL